MRDPAVHGSSDEKYLPLTMHRGGALGKLARTGGSLTQPNAPLAILTPGEPDNAEIAFAI